MSKFYFIKCEYRVEEEAPIIYLFGRNISTQEKVLFRVSGFEPYFYVPEKDSVPNIPQIRRVVPGFKTIFGEPVKKIICKVPEDVKDLKKQFSNNFEADIPYTRRFLINIGIRKYFTVPDEKTELNYMEIKGE